MDHFRVLFVLFAFLFIRTNCEILTPPYFNLAEGKKIVASATCGVNTTEPELYCKLVGANADQDEDVNLIQGQVCDYCDPTNPAKSHPPEHAVDGMETWWQSPPLSRSMKYNEVTLTIDLGQEFHVAYVFVVMGNSPRPGLWVLEKSTDYGSNWSPWQYFSDSASDCTTYFGVDAHSMITRDDSVICTTEFSNVVPLEGGEIPISILNNRPNAHQYFNSTVLQEWTRATNVRFRLLRTKNLLGHLMSVARQDPTVTRRYFYSIKDIIIGGRCMCNGHADTCDIQDPSQPKKLVCRCQHNTDGPQCASCRPGFQQKKWQQSTSVKKFICEPCNCFGHSTACTYNSTIDELHLSLDIHGNYEGGGECKACEHNTEGTNCHRCKPRFYRPRDKKLNDTDVCQPCNCNLFNSTGNCAELTGRCECRKEFTPPDCNTCNYGYYGYPKCRPCDCHLEGTDGYHCEAKDGVCPCKSNFAGHYCDLCAEGYYNYPECLPCACTKGGSLNDVCDVVTGNCTCKNNYGGRSCNDCEHGYYDYPTCTYCNCDSRGTEPEVCDKGSGQCLCKEGYGGARCDQCVSGYYGYPNCRPCSCSTIGSSSVSCDSTGKCSCLDNFSGRTCAECSPGYFRYPECVPCNCDGHGSIGVSCDLEGKCQCRESFSGDRCDQCTPGFYNFPRCESCNCDPAGIVKSFAGCGSLPAGELCQCKDRVEGRICNQCKPLYWNLLASNPDGCQSCQCHVPGVVGGIGECEPKQGQCICKPGVTARDCSQCIDGTHDLRESNLFGCQDCGCDIGGSVSPICNKESGQCACQPRIHGLNCKEPLQAHYFPTLHQFQYEVEDAQTPGNTPVRYDYNETIFPGFSWRGYAAFDVVLNEIVQRVYIHQSSIYRMVLRYVNRNSESVTGKIIVTPDNPGDSEQSFNVQFKPSVEPAFVTVAGASGNLPSPFVLNPGQWSVKIIPENRLFVDYFVLLPSEYYEATILTHDVNLPCEVGYQGLCRHFNYPNLGRFDSVGGTGGFVDADGVRIPLNEYFTDREVLREVEREEIPLINDVQPEIHFELRIGKPGPHVFVVTYVTSKDDSHTATLMIDINSSVKGKATLNPCKYTSICRQVVTDRYGKITVLDFQSNYISLVLSGEPDSPVAIDSVVAIPYEDWSLDYIKPKSVCVRKNGKCVQGIFPPAADAKKVEFETGNEVLDVGSRPPGIYDNTTKLIYLNSENGVVDVSTSVPESGEYVFIALYYQPDHPGFELEVLVQNGKFYEATLPVSHCPSNSGCRGIVTQADGDTRFQLVKDVVLSFKSPGETGIWLDYVLIIPADQYDDKILKKVQFDQTKDFIKRCGHNHFHINVTDEGFCRDSVFSLTTYYNNGALPCLCAREGTTSFECAKFGGQCPCKENIIGRRCEACKTGFYGYPNCKPCNCPKTAVCEARTGECSCPPGVVGEQCDQCEVGTFGYHPIVGCEDCDCSRLGVLNGDLQCDLLNGNCKCKENVVNRKCDKCRPGYSQFPHCERCDCDGRGTTEDICDQYTAECHCKQNVQGQACDVCKEGTFNIQHDNEEGCSKCFCFGKTSRCSSASLYRIQTQSMLEWNTVLVEDKIVDNVTQLLIGPQEVNDTSIVIGLTNGDIASDIVYFSAPEIYLGKKLTSYGGFLNYTIHYSTGPYGKAVRDADVILEGSGNLLLHFADEQPPSFTNFQGSLKLVESNFVMPSNLAVNREQLLIVLENLEAIYIRATYWTPSIEATLSDVTLDEATESYSHRNRIFASSVEQCQCPPNYQGLSCEECADGYYRVKSGPNGGYCVKCQCNGHSESCDVDTGICHDCKNGTTGDHCELCQEGYYGNATMGTPSDCLICACPMPFASNNFAKSCEVNEDGDKIRCECKPGYYGLRCQSCSAGFYGEPEVEGAYCKPCECSGNIDTNQIDACDSISGECLRCLNNTYGQACNLCAPGFFGDAVERKDCQSCLCDQCGMDKCDSYNGICQCKKNVIGEKCDRCDLNHYGFGSCNGCEACDCGEASESSQCDETTGQCRCKPGVTGRKCDRCIAGYWNYGPEGCISCGCNTGYSIGASCNTTTGQCSCLPGVIGEKCDHCPYRYVLKEGDGCYECDSCIHDVLDVTDALATQLGPVAEEFESVSESYFTNQHLKFINDTVNKLEPVVQRLDRDLIDFVPLQTEIDRLEQEVSNQRRKGEYLAEGSDNWKSRAENTLKDMNSLESEAAGEIQSVRRIVAEIESLEFNVESGTGAKVDEVVKQAEGVLKQIQDMSFTKFRDAANDQAGQANILVSEMTEYSFPVSNLSSTTENLAGKMRDFSAKVDDLYSNAVKAEKSVNIADDLISENKRAVEIGNFDAVKNSTNEATDDIAAGTELNSNATILLQETALFIDELRGNEIETALEKLRNTITDNDDQLLDIQDVVNRAEDHASTLYAQSIDLDSVLTDTRHTSAVRAVSAYRDIDETIRNARADAQEASQAANNATTLSHGVEDRTNDAHARSMALREKAINALRRTKGDLRKELEGGQTTVSAIDDTNKKNNASLEYIERILNNLEIPKALSIDDLTAQTTKLNDSIYHQLANMNGIIKKIPDDLKTAKQLSKDTSDALRDVSQVKKILDSVDKVVPNIESLLDNLGERQAGIDRTGNDLLKKIENLKMKVAHAREQADRFKTCLTFYRNTTLQLKNPESLPLLASTTKLSVYFRTNKTNGFLLYLGNEKNSQAPRAKSHDFASLLIESGYPVLLIDLGSGPEKIISNKFVSDNVWRQIIVDRTGESVKLIVREDIGEGKDELFVKEQILPGTSSIFNLDKDQSKLFVGGYPSSYQIQEAVTASSFEGEMEDLVVGDIPVSMWNFVHGENNRQCAGERDKLIDLALMTVYRFERNGYAKMSMKASKVQWDAKKFRITLKFKTFANEGLIYLMAKGAQFLSLEIRNGEVVYQFDLGQGVTVLRSKEKFNDGEWHLLEARRLDRIGVLTIDRELVAKGEGTGKTKHHQAADVFYIGGYPEDVESRPEVTKMGFDGCVDDIVILDTSIDLSRSVHALGLVPGCPVKFASLVSFEDAKPGYVRLNNVTAPDNQLSIHLKFKTLAENGLIFYATNPDQTANSFLSLVDGVLVFKSQGEELHTGDSRRFNDNEWHVVTAIHNDQALRMDIDETENYSTDFVPPSLSIVGGSLYIGGLPNSFGTGSSVSKATMPFVGCIGDSTINGLVVNFASTKERPNAFLGKCIGGESTLPSPPIERPDNWPPPPHTEDYETITMASNQSNIVSVDPDDTHIADTIDANVPGEGRPKEVDLQPETTSEYLPETTQSPTTIFPQTVDQCTLPYYPETDPEPENAWRFGTVRYSRLEYRSLRGRYKYDYDFQIDVRTLDNDGIIFYAKDFTGPDLIAVYLEDGKVNYKFDCGSGPAVLTSQLKIADNQWHTVVFKRKDNLGELVIDEEASVSGYSLGESKTIDIAPPFYVGGVLPEISASVLDNIGMNKSFSGCLGNFMMNGQSVGEADDRFGVIPCSKRVEPGLFFYPGNGSNLFKAMDKFSVGQNVDIQMEIKPRSTSGHLLSIHGRRHFVLLEMVNGTIKFLVKAAKGPIETSFEPSSQHSLCDGNWHNIRAIKESNAVLLSVDHDTAPAGIGPKNHAGVLTKHPVFVGGHPLLARKLRGSTSHAQYVGCIRNIMINRSPIHLDPERAYGKVTTGVCPTI